MKITDVRPTRRAMSPKIVIYGPGKIGKSTFAASAPAPVGILTEDGLHNLDVQAFPVCQSLMDVYEAIGELIAQPHDFKTVFLDSLDWLEPLVHAHVCRQHGWKDIEAAGYGKGYVAAAEEWRQVLAGLDALRAERGMTVILIAHDQIKRFESPLSDGYDIYTLKLHQRASALVQEWADVIGFAQYQTFTKTTAGGFDKKQTRAIGNGERRLYVEARPAFVAGNRFGLPAELPLSWQGLVDALPVPF